MSKAVKTKNLIIGGGAPISVQSMTDTKTSDIERTVSQILALEKAGADLVRIAVSDEESARAVKKIKQQINVPLAVDIQYDHKLALLSEGADKIRINPGNIGSRDKVEYLAKHLKERGIPIRIGVNSGSAEKEFKHLPPAEAMFESAMRHVKILEDVGFYDIIIAAKSSNVSETVAVNRMLKKYTDYPLHLGVTESGFGMQGLIKSSAGIGALLLDGIGDTIRVSLTGDPVQEVYAGRMLLNSLDLRADMVEIVSCPTCGRTVIDVEKAANEIFEAAKHLKKKVKIAVMGCVVNGIGESENADFGVAGGKEKSIIFKDGKQLKTVENVDIIPELMKMLEAYC